MNLLPVASLVSWAMQPAQPPPLLWTRLWHREVTGRQAPPGEAARQGDKAQRSQQPEELL